MGYEYNGWTNRATWNVQLWITNEYSTYQLITKLFKDSKNAGAFADNLEHFLAIIWGKFTPDKVSMANVNWVELADMWYDENTK